MSESTPDLPPPPYPAETQAKGWKFELDYDAIEKSDTWPLAAEIPMAQHALLMMWFTAWSKQKPCGSFPNDENTIRAACRIPPAVWAKCRDVLMRGWWLADDGRLYHNTLTKRVREMMRRRRNDSDRQNARRARKDAESAADHTDVTRDTTADPSGVGAESSTENGELRKTYTEDLPDPGAGPENAEAEIVGTFTPTPAGVVCKALRQAGIADTNPGHPRLLALLEAGAQPAEFTGFVTDALKTERPFAWLLGAVEGERTRAAKLAPQLHRGAMPNKQQALEQRNRAVADSWAAQQGEPA